MGYLDNTGLTYFWGKIKSAFGATLSVSGRTVTLKSKSGATLSTIETQDTTYSNATTSANGLMSKDDKSKLDGIATGANKYTLPTATASVLGGVKTGDNITNKSGVLSLTKDNVIGALGYTPPTTDTTYEVATTSANGLMSSGDKTKLNGIATGATKNSITTTTVTLTVSGWSNKIQTVTVNGVTSSNMVVVNAGNGISCTSQASNTLTFTCEDVPTEDLTVNVAILS